MPTKLTFLAKKGGVGKTTLTLNFAGYMASQKQARVLMIDADPQASLSQGLLSPPVVEKLPLSNTVAALFDTTEYPDPDKIIKDVGENLWLAPASELLEAFHIPMNQDHGDIQFAFKNFVDDVAEHFDYVVFDTPPNSSNLLPWNCLMASDYTVTPLNMEAYSAQSVAGVIAKLEDAHANGNRELQSLGYVINLRAKQRILHQQLEQAARGLYGSQVFESVLYNWTKFPEAQTKRTHIFEYAPDSKEAESVKEFADELLGRMVIAKRRAA